MTRSLAVVLAAGALSALIIWPVYGAHPAVVTAALVAGVSIAGLAVAHALAGRRSGGSLRSRFVLVAAVAVAVILASVLAAAKLMFVSKHDALVISAIVLAAAVVALRAAHVAASRLIAEVASIRDVLRAVGAGEREPRADAGAASELAELAAEANAMIEQLAAEEHRRDAAESARRNLVAAISHDLRTPITSLRLMADAIEDDLAVVDDRVHVFPARAARAAGALGGEGVAGRLEAGEFLDVHVQQLAGAGPLIADDRTTLGRRPARAAAAAQDLVDGRVRPSGVGLAGQPPRAPAGTSASFADPLGLLARHPVRARVRPRPPVPKTRERGALPRRSPRASASPRDARSTSRPSRRPRPPRTSSPPPRRARPGAAGRSVSAERYGVASAPPRRS
jgi:His Kinase A (phospho-acceptor) domain